jgi:diacylglycerol kinase family enzyme
MPRAPRDIAAIVRNDRCVAHDVGRIDLGTRHCWFINVAGAGLDAYVIQQLPGRVSSRLAYLAGAIRALRHYRAPLFAIETRPPGSAPVTAAATRRGRFLLAFVANGRYCGPQDACSARRDP